MASLSTTNRLIFKMSDSGLSYRAMKKLRALLADDQRAIGYDFVPSNDETSAEDNPRTTASNESGWINIQTYLIYTPLDTRLKEIRILTIEPDDDPGGYIMGPIVCNLTTVSLLKCPTYDCISYCWGDPLETATITVNGVERTIGFNLSTALRQFREDSKNHQQPLYLWADAICINQSDTAERNSQVAMMRDIYAQAANVRIWLGPSYSYSEKIASAFKLLRLVGTDGKTKPLESEKWIVPHMLNLGDFFGNPYWKRRWVTQEIVLARALTIHLGPISQPLSVEKELANVRKFAKSMLPLDQVFSDKTDGLNFFESASVFEPTRCILSVLLPIVTGNKLVKHGHKTITNIVTHLRGPKSSNRSDYVYALLGMIPKEVGLIPDYNKSWKIVFAEFTVRIMNNTASLSLLHFAPPAKASLSTWVLDWTVDRGYYDDLLSVDHYFAGAGTPFSLAYSPPDRICLRGLVVDGIQANGLSTTNDPNKSIDLEESFKILSAPNEHRILKNWAKLYQQLGRTSQKTDPIAGQIPEAVVRTVLTDRGTPVQVEFGGEQLNMTRRLTHNELRWCKEGVDRFVMNAGVSVHYAVTKLLQNMRKYDFFMTSGGRPGMAKRGILAGDKICIFSSAEIPYCVRPKRIRGEIVYSIISPCYVDGIMDGEAILTALAVADTIGDSPETDSIFEDIALV